MRKTSLAILAALLAACTSTNTANVQPPPRASDYIFADATDEREALQYEARLLDAQQKLAGMESIHAGLNAAATRGGTTIYGQEVPGPLQDSRRYRTRSDDTERHLLENAVRDATIDFNRFLADAVRNGRAAKRTGL